MVRSLSAAPQTDIRDTVLKATGGPALSAIARLPERARRLLLGGRSISIDGNTLDSTVQLTLALQRLSGREGLIQSSDVATARARINLTASQFPRADVDVTRTDIAIPGVIPGADADIPAVHVRAANADGAPLLVFYHGGGFVVGGYATHGHLCEVVSQQAGVHVLFVDYRLAPEHKAPAAVDDAYVAYLWAREHAAELGADPDRVAVGGDSAGGNLAAVVAQRARSEGDPQPALQWLLYPVTNFANQTRSYGLFDDGFFLRRRDMEFGRGHYVEGSGVDPTDPRVSPLLADDLSGLAPAIVVTAGFDPLRDEGRQYVEALRAAGNRVAATEYGSLIHAFPHFFTLGGAATTATHETISALGAHLSRS